jgi:hypothetical protein
LRIIGGTVQAGDWPAANFGPLYNDAAQLRDDHLAMETAPRQIVAFGGGFSMESGNPLLDDHVLGLCRRERPAGGTRAAPAVAA